MTYPASQTVKWKSTKEGLVPFVVESGKEQEATWAPQPGSQVAFLKCPVYEALYEGTRGPGKTDAMLMDFAQHVSRGYGAEWRGIVFRRTYPELKDLIDKSLKWFPRIFPQARYNRAEHVWTFPKGEQLIFRYMQNEEDYWSYHGHSYPWIGWEELTTWPNDRCYRRMFACSRSTVPDMPRKIRATTNPYGVGHNWVKARWRLPISRDQMIGKVIYDSMDDTGQPEPPRVAIHGKLDENRILLFADPGYKDRIRAAARNPAELRAWLHGDWDIVAGGMLDDVWNNRVHVVPNVPPHIIPQHWVIDRSYDHGQSKPFSVAWWAESNGEPFRYNNFTYGTVRGDLYRIAEWYGWNRKPNEGLRLSSERIAQGILDRETDWDIKGRVRRGVADSSIFDEYEPLMSVAGDMRRVGVQWEKADKGPGSRKQGWQQIRKYLENAAPNGRAREFPGLFIMERCDQFLRTVPVLPRDDRDLDDVDTEAEDHIGDEVRYRLRHKRKAVSSGVW